jgi:cellobiose transport system substrate-binding protein
VRLSRPGRAAVAVAGAAAFALVATGCAPGAASDKADGPITVSIATFNDFGYSDALFAEYEALHPGIKIVHNKAALSSDARNNFFTKLGAGSGLSDVEAVEVDWLAEMMQYSNKLTDIGGDAVEGRWLDWVEKAATDTDGRLVAYGTDIGPEAVCYRSDLLEAAGLPSSREDVAALLEGGWDRYYEVGQQYVAATGKPWFDSAGSTYKGVVNQMKNAYEDGKGNIIATKNPDVSKGFASVLTASSTLSAGLKPWTDDWTKGLGTGAFATMLCPSWMLGVIKGNGPDITGWDIANVFPAGGGNWGGAYLTVPAQGKHIKEATEFAQWMTEPEQQLKAFAKAGNFPSQPAAYDNPELINATNDYFRSAPVGKIMIDRSAAVAVAPYKGKDYFAVSDLVQNGLDRVDVDKSQTIDQSWKQVVSEIDAL